VWRRHSLQGIAGLQRLGQARPAGRDIEILNEGEAVDDSRELVDRYAAIWNEPDPQRRRRAVAALWTEDAVQVLQPPQAVQDAAAALDVTPTFQARGHGELEARVARAYEEFVAPGEFSFKSQHNPARLGDVVKFGWEMVSSSGEVAAVGLEFVILDADGRIQTDYQFIEN
jgi:hypothetical protein